MARVAAVAAVDDTPQSGQMAAAGVAAALTVQLRTRASGEIDGSCGPLAVSQSRLSAADL